MIEIEPINSTLTEQGTYQTNLTLVQIEEINYCLKLVANQRRTAKEHQQNKRTKEKLEREAKGEPIKPIRLKNPTTLNLYQIVLPTSFSPILSPKSLPPKVPSPTLNIIRPKSF